MSFNFGSILSHVLQFYSDKVTKKGKPQGSEFTIFASFVLVDCSKGNDIIIRENQYIVCSLGTGTKCIGHDLIEKDLNNGYLLHDCHAEVMARRSFLKFLYNLLDCGKCSLYFDWVEEEKKWKLKKDFELHLILTELPCGDCSIVDTCSTVSTNPKQTENKSNDSSVSENSPPKVEMKRKADEINNTSSSEPKTKKTKLIMEGRTGSKILHHDLCTHEKFGEDQVINVVRLKPGGGNRNQSMSCSDKITKWNIVGIQGSLLSNFFEPICVDKFLILLSEKSKLDLNLVQQRLTQSIVSRVGQLTNSSPSFHLFKEGSSGHLPFFIDRASDSKVKGSGYSIGCYLKIEDGSYCEEIVIGMKGHKQGTTKKDENSPKSASQLSKHGLFKTFINYCAKKQHNDLSSILDNQQHSMQTYYAIKKKESNYTTQLNLMKLKSPFDKWIIKKL